VLGRVKFCHITYFAAIAVWYTCNFNISRSQVVFVGYDAPPKHRFAKQYLQTGETYNAFMFACSPIDPAFNGQRCRVCLGAIEERTFYVLYPASKRVAGNNIVNHIIQIQHTDVKVRGFAI
jgi:hypothetical protein